MPGAPWTSEDHSQVSGLSFPQVDFMDQTRISLAVSPLSTKSSPWGLLVQKVVESQPLSTCFTSSETSEYKTDSFIKTPFKPLTQASGFQS